MLLATTYSVEVNYKQPPLEDIGLQMKTREKTSTLTEVSISKNS